MAHDRHLGGLWCHQLLEGLSDYLDGSLPPEVQPKVQAHLEQCPHCAQFGAQFAEMLGQARRLRKARALAPDTAEALWAALEDHLPQS